MELYEIAIKNSQWAWDKLREAKKCKFQIGEESITDLLVLNFKKWGKGKIVVNTFTRHKEAINGSDWEWWFTGPSGKWLGMRIQAKVLNLISEKYEHLHYSNKNGKQVDLLINDARKNSLIPLYFMYTNWSPGCYRPGWKCKTYRSSVWHYGASMLNPKVVKKLEKRNKTRLKSVINDLRPMHCIFCCSGYLHGDMPNRALGWLEGSGLFFKPDAEMRESDTKYLRDNPPHYVAQLMSHELNDDFTDLQDARLKRVTVFKEIGGENT